MSDSGVTPSLKPTAAIAASLLEQHGVHTAILSPGSRNAPLLLAVAQCKTLHKHIVIDERAAAFVALGYAAVSSAPVALVCTSGTAMLNYAPAVAEAYYQGLPLIILTADRPMQWIDQDDSQTIRQYEALEHFVKGSFDIPDVTADDDEMLWYARRTINRALLLAVSGKAGPVHINMQYNTPLTGETLQPWSGRCCKVDLITASGELGHEQARQLAESLRGKRILVCAGYMPPNHKIYKALSRFAALPQVAVLAEKLSNLHLPVARGGIDTILSTISAAEAVRFVPDVVITLGGALVSRFVKEFLRKCEAVEHWSLDNSDMMADCFRHLTLKIDVDPAVFFARVGMYLKRYESDSDYKEIWETRRCAALLSQKEFIQRAGWCDLTAHYIIFNSLPTDYNVVCSNGTAVRYAELFASVSQHAVCCNRGTSGIEGCTATAVGSAMAYNGETILLSGDMSLMHDLGGLSIARRLAPRLKIVVFNNGGGDIFRFIATTSRLDECEEYFACNQSATLDCSALAAAFGLKYIRVHSVEELQCGMTTLLASSECMLLEVDTRGYDNAGILRAYMQRTVK